MINNKLNESDGNGIESDATSDSHNKKRTRWVIASEVAGIEGMPTTDRRARDELERLSIGKEGVKRKRSGTKAFEYHISILPQYVVDALTKGGFMFDEDDIEHSDSKDYPGPTYICSEPIKEPSRVYVSFLDEFSLIPSYQVHVSAGHGALNHGEMEPLHHEAVPRKWLQRRGFSEKDLAIVWGKGDSMEPTIYNNDMLVVHLRRTTPVDGYIYVVRNDDQLWVKYIQTRPKSWLLLSENELYPPIEVPKDEQHNFDVIGQVVHIAHDTGE
jgi:phage repressor protein C with HTH and peptisase S24 domain